MLNTEMDSVGPVIRAGSGNVAGWSAESRLSRRITARDVLAMFFAYYWRNRSEIEVPGNFLVALLAGFDIAAPNVRATLRRLEKEDLLDTRKAGRNLFFSPSAHSRDLVEPGVLRIFHFGVKEDWDGTWTMVVFSIPEKNSNIRLSLRESLRAVGFAPYYDGVWVAPGDKRDVALSKADLFEVPQLSTHLVSNDSFKLRGRQPIDSWDLDSLSEGYATLIEEGQDLLAQCRAGRLSPTSALSGRTILLARYRWLVPLDPGLPMEMMPDGWLRTEARSVIAEAFDELSTLCEFRFDQLLDGIDEPWADRIRAFAHLSLDELASLNGENL